MKGKDVFLCLALMEKSLGRYQVVEVYIFFLRFTQTTAATAMRVKENRWDFSCTQMFYRKCMIRVLHS